MHDVSEHDARKALKKKQKSLSSGSMPVDHVSYTTHKQLENPEPDTTQEPKKTASKSSFMLRRLSGVSNHEVPSYGVHRFSNVSRLMFAFMLTALATVVILGLSMLIAWEFDDIRMENATLTLAIICIGAALAVVVATLIGFISARGITTPLKRVTAVVSELKRQNFNVRTGFTGFDEIGRLGRTLDEMAEAVQSAHDYERQISVDLAHELRTPLMAMRATLEAMIDDVVPADLEHLVILHTSVVRLGRLVDALLKLSRLEHRNMVFNVQRVELGELIDNLVTSYLVLAEDSGLELSFKGKKNVYVLGDADLLRQATSDLISNAIRYTPEGGKVHVEVEKLGAFAQIEVRDTGKGIASENLKNVFTKFWRASDDRGSEGGGLGIGLAIIKEIVELHEGTVEVSSSLGQGSSFFIRVPLNTPSPPDESTKRS